MPLIPLCMAFAAAAAAVTYVVRRLDSGATEYEDFEVGDPLE
jgi:hypothetical protein